MLSVKLNKILIEKIGISFLTLRFLRNSNFLSIDHHGSESLTLISWGGWSRCWSWFLLFLRFCLSKRRFRCWSSIWIKLWWKLFRCSSRCSWRSIGWLSSLCRFVSFLLVTILLWFFVKRIYVSLIVDSKNFLDSLGSCNILWSHFALLLPC